MFHYTILFRLLLGCVFLVSGFEKVISPYQNFLYVIQSYDVVPAGLDHIVAQVFPWVELFAGVFLVLGLWTVWTLRLSLLMLTAFLGIVGQAMIRGLPIDECGCFGELMTLPLWGVFLLDTALFGCAAAALFQIDKTERFSLDQYFAKES